MFDLTQISDEELHTRYLAYNDEINRRNEMQRIPQEIGNLAQQGRDIGVSDSVMIEAIKESPTQ